MFSIRCEKDIETYLLWGLACLLFLCVAYVRQDLCEHGNTHMLRIDDNVILHEVHSDKRRPQDDILV